MTNAEKFKTAGERAKEFGKWCEKYKIFDSHGNTACAWRCVFCHFAWLDREVEEENPLPCPSCGGDVVVGFATNIHGEEFRQVWCKNEERCGYRNSVKKTSTEAIAAHNSLARAAMETGKKEEK